jgi:putative tryptophan/tyrosine transport system substrate-binding protein
MRRRDVLATLLLAAVMWPSARAQPGKVYRIAIVDPSAQVSEMTETGQIPYWRAFFEGLRQHGYIEGQNLAVERYSGEGRTERFAELAGSVVHRQPDLIVAVTTRMALHFKAATKTIPIVAMTVDPIAFGLVTSLAQPEGNITGVTVDAGVEIWGKRLQLLKEAAPNAYRVGWLAPRAVWESGYGSVIREVAQRAGFLLLGPPLDGLIDAAEYRRVFAAMAEARPDGFIVFEAPENLMHRRLIVELVQKSGLPAIYGHRDHVAVGGLMAYHADREDIYRRVSGQIHRILKGAAPGEVPFTQATKFYLAINLKTMKELGLALPPSFLARADEVIE